MLPFLPPTLFYLLYLLFYPEYVQCSNRGFCDIVTGTCRCYPDLVNINCEDFKPAVIVSGRAIAGDVLTIIATNPQFFDSASLSIDSTIPIGGEQTIITANDQSGSKWSLTGAGYINMNYGGLTIGTNGTDNTGGLTIAVGGLTVTRGVTVYTGGLVSNGLVTIDSLGVDVNEGGVSAVGGYDAKDSPLYVTGGGTVSGGLYINGTVRRSEIVSITYLLQERRERDFISILGSSTHRLFPCCCPR